VTADIFVSGKIDDRRQPAVAAAGAGSGKQMRLLITRGSQNTNATL
jgi:microcompartment protein CcmK/EutM